MDVSVVGWWLGGCMQGCVGRWVVFGWIHGWMCWYVFDGCVDTWRNVSVGGWWLGVNID